MKSCVGFWLLDLFMWLTEKVFREECPTPAIAFFKLCRVYEYLRVVSNEAQHERDIVRRVAVDDALALLYETITRLI